MPGPAQHVSSGSDVAGIDAVAYIDQNYVGVRVRMTPFISAT